MKKEKSVTLVELIIAISLIGVMAITMGSLGTSIYAMKKDVFDKQESSIQGHLAIATIFERVLRAEAKTSGPAFTISDGGKTLQYKRSGKTETIRLDDATDTIKYDDGSSVSIILRDAKTLNFSQDYQNRLAVLITLNNDETFRTAVQPRNEFTPQGTIN